MLTGTVVAESVETVRRRIAEVVERLSAIEHLEPNERAILNFVR